MKRLIAIAVAFAIVGVLVSLKLRARSEEAPLEQDGDWELADEPAAP